MNVKQSVAGKKAHPELRFPGCVKVGKTAVGLLMTWMWCQKAVTFKPLVSSVGRSSWLVPVCSYHCAPSQILTSALSARLLHLLYVSDSPVRVKLTAKHLLSILWKTAARRSRRLETARAIFTCCREGLRVFEDEPACLLVLPVSTLINNVTAHVATWPVSSQQPTDSCQELFNFHTNKRCLAVILRLPYKAAFLGR